MSLIPIASLANGTVYTTVPFVGPQNPTGAKFMTPAVGQQVHVYAHGTTTPAAVYTDEAGLNPSTQPLVTGADGSVPGFIDPATLPLDLVVNGETYELAGSGGSGGSSAITSVNGKTGVVVLTASDVGADAAGVAATETTRAQAAEALLAPKASPAFTGTPTASTPAALDNSTKLATTAYADAAVAVETSRATSAEALKAPLASPALTGAPTAPTPTAGDNSTKIATTAYVQANSGSGSGALPATGTTGSPTSGTWVAKQLAVDSNNGLWKCLVGGTPGTWERVVSAITPQDFGAKGDAVWSPNAAITTGTATLKLGNAYHEAVLADGPKAYYRLDESAGTTATDTSVNGGNNGTYSGGFTLAQAGLIAGDSDTAVSFNGSTGTATLPLLALGDGPFTVEVWIKRNALSGAGQFPTFFAADNGLMLLFAASDWSGGIPQAVQVNQQNGVTLCHSPTGIADTTTAHHIVYTKNGASSHLYVDGVDVTVLDTNATLVNSAFASGSIGSDRAGNFSSAVIDEVAVYPIVLTPAQVSGHYAIGTSSGPLVSTDAGKLASVVGAGAAGATLVTTISSVTDSRTATLAANASTTVAGATAVHGTDDTAAIRAWLAALNGSVPGQVTGRHMTAIGSTPFSCADKPGLVLKGTGALTRPLAGCGGANDIPQSQLMFMPQSAIINTASGGASFFSFGGSSSPSVKLDGIAIINANRAYNGVLADFTSDSAVAQGPGCTIRDCYIGGIDAGVIGTANGGQRAVDTDAQLYALLENSSFYFCDILWRVCTLAANGAKATNCNFSYYGTVACQNPGEDTTFIATEFGLKYASTLANQSGAAINTTAGYTGWTGSCVFLNCHFNDAGTSVATTWITAGNAHNTGAAPYWGGLAILGGYLGHGTGTVMVSLATHFDCVFIDEYSSTFGEHPATFVALNGHTLTNNIVNAGGGG